MTERITVDDAIKRGRRMIWLPAYILFFACLFLAPIVAVLAGAHVFWGVVAGILSGSVLQTLLVSYKVTKWRIWAFSHVTDVHELKIAAIHARLIPPDGSWQIFFEIRTKADKRALEAVEERFARPAPFIDDSSVPEETHIYSAPVPIAYKFLAGSAVALLLAALLLAVYGINPYNGMLFIAGFICLAGSKMIWPKSKKREPLLTLSNQGIRLPKCFDTWDNISDEELVKTVYYGRNGTSVHHKLKYMVTGGALITLDLDDINIPHERLLHILYVYRKRYQASL